MRAVPRSASLTLASFKSLEPFAQFVHSLLQQLDCSGGRIGDGVDGRLADEGSAALVGVDDALCAELCERSLHRTWGDAVVVREFSGAWQLVVALQAAMPDLVLHVLHDALIGLQVFGRHSHIVGLPR